MDITSLIAISIVAIGMLFYDNSRYRKSAYYQITRKSRWFMDTGSRGEYLIYECLRHHEKRGGKFLFNVYLPTKDNGTSEIDILMINSKGIFVFESKNYSGWIFGDEQQKQWTQTLPLGRGRSHKERFYNPLMQNAPHISHLREIIGGNYLVWSIIVFSDHCNLKRITLRGSGVPVINRRDISSAVTRVCTHHDDTLTEQEVHDVYCKLHRYSQVTPEKKAQHIQNLQNKKARRLGRAFFKQRRSD